MNISSLSTIKLIVAVVFVFISAITGLSVWDDHAETLRQAQESTENIAHLLEQDLRHTVEVADVAILRVRDRLQGRELFARQGTGYESGALQQVLTGLSRVALMFVADAHGVILSKSDNADLASATIEDREYFRKHRDGQEFVIGGLVNGRFTGKRVFTISRRLTGPQGEFAGIVVVGIAVDSFKTSYSDLKLGKNPAISVFGTDGRVLIRYGGNEEAGRLQVTDVTSPLFAAQQSRPNGVVRLTSSFDRIERLVSYRTLADLSLFVAAGMAEEDFMAPWRERAGRISTLALVSLALLSGLILLALYARHNETTAGRQLERRSADLAAALAQRDQLLKALTRSEMKFRLALQHTRVAVYSQDRDLRYNWAYNIPGCFDAERMLDRTAHDIFPAAEAACLEMVKRQVMDSREGTRLSMTLTLNDHPIPLDLKIEPLVDIEGEVEGVICTAIDVTEDRESQFALAAARAEAERANQAKSRFLAAASHDLRQPLQALNLYLHLLSERLQRPENKAVIERALQAMDAGNQLLSALLDRSKLDSGLIQATPQPLSVQAVLRNIEQECRPMAEAQGLSLRIVASNAVIHSDPVLFQRILRNLALNAIRYTRQGGIVIGCRRRAGRLGLAVYDSGIGIPADKLDLIFEDFYQIGNHARDRAEGLGLGLAIVKRMAELLGHRVTVRSQPGRGSVFCLWVGLPETENIAIAAEVPERFAALQPA